MIWQGETYRQMVERREQWHEWFAWRPIQLEDGRWFWFETVERCIKPTYDSHVKHYREMT